MNWTIAKAGTNRNVIPAEATASADVRVLRIADHGGLGQQVNERIKNRLIPDAGGHELECRRPPLDVSQGKAQC